jgi:tripartite tricarboxylate transporter TctA family protein
MEGLFALARSLITFLHFWPILLTLGSTLVGIMIGCMPGLSATLGIALLTTLTIKMPPNDAILILISAYIGAIYGGSRTAILLNIPGTDVFGLRIIHFIRENARFFCAGAPVLRLINEVTNHSPPPSVVSS